MISRREFMQITAAAAAVSGLGGDFGRLVARAALSQEDLLRFAPKGQLTILHMADCHAQLKPIYFREPSLNLGVGQARGQLPHLVGQDFLSSFGIPASSLDAYMLTAADFEALARSYGRVGGMDRVATLINAIRAERGAERVLLLDGGDSLQGSYTALQSRGGDMVAVMQALGVEATTGHWEFTLGAERVAEIFGTRNRPGSAGIPFLAGNVRDTDFEEPVFHALRFFEKGGVNIAVIGQAFPYTPIANPRWMIPEWSFGIRESSLRKTVAAARRKGAEVMVLLSHNGFDVDRKLAGRVEGIDVILTGHTHDALPAPIQVGNTLLIASGSNGKFVSRLDLEVENGRVKDFAYALIPVLADAITPDPAMAQVIADVRAPHEAMLTRELGRTEGLLYRRGTFAGTLDDLICDAVLAQRDAEIAFSPGFRWGPTLLAGQPITWEDVYNATAITYPAVYRTVMSGAAIKTTLEGVADNLFYPDPYLQQGGDMVRVGGMGFTVHVDRALGERISAMHLLRSGAPIDAGRDYVVAGWASINEDVEGPAIWDVVAQHVKGRSVVPSQAGRTVKFVRAGN
ncbi:MAG: thiosulfohydrolase SoxB [Hyphomonadaceae bacterium]|nr:thiosulfohydrolase SoxB [Hyphomonadaceae bacterium]